MYDKVRLYHTSKYMKSNYETMPFKVKDLLDERKFSIPVIQRNLVWNSDKKIKFIDNVRKGDPFGVILVRLIDGKYEIIDGLQRITTIKDYYKNMFEYLDSKVLDVCLMRKLLSDNLEAQGVSPETQSENYYENKLKDISVAIFDLLKNKKTEMEIVSEIVSTAGLMPNNPKLMQDIIDIVKKFYADTNIDDLEVFAINYIGPSENIPNIFYNLNTGGVSLSKYETFSALWHDTNYLISDEEITNKIIKKYETLSEESDLDVEYDEEKIKNEGITLFEYCFALGHIVKEREFKHDLITEKSLNNPSKTDPIGFELLTLIFGKPISKAEDLYTILKDSKPEFLIELKKIICETVDVVFPKLKEFVIGLNGKKLLSESDYLLYHIIISYIKEYYLISPETNTITEIESHYSKSNFKKYMPFVYLVDTFSDFWKNHRQVSDLDTYIKDDNRRHRYWNRLSQQDLNDCMTYFFSIQENAPKTIWRNNKIFIDIYTKFNLELNYPGQISNFKRFFDDNKKYVKLDYEHISPKKRIEDKLGANQKDIAMSRVGNLCYLTITENRSKGKKTIYEYLKDRPALTFKQEYLDAIDYPMRDELIFLECDKENFVKGFNKLTKERENRLQKNMLDFIKKKYDSLA